MFVSSPTPAVIVEACVMYLVKAAGVRETWLDAVSYTGDQEPIASPTLYVRLPHMNPNTQTIIVSKYREKAVHF